MKRWIILALLGAVLLLLVACGQSADTNTPPEIMYGQDVCDQCGMIISEEKFAAAYWTVDGEARRFDDIGGMFAYIAANPEEAASYWVHDITTGDWIRAEEAYYVSDSDLMTPMGFGIAACATEDQAQALAYGKENVMVMSFAKMLSSSKAMDEMQDDHSG